MPYKYIGRTHGFVGKTLWELVGNLKDFGVGRLVYRNWFYQRYPEPSFMKILKVEALAESEEPSVDNLRKVRVLVEKTFRGQKLQKPIWIESTSYKPDYRLVPKDEEEKFYNYRLQAGREQKIYPRTMEFPPLMKEMLLREMKNKGVVTDLEMEIAYNKNEVRVAKEGENPNVEFKIGLGEPASLCLYKGVKL